MQTKTTHVRRHFSAKPLHAAKRHFTLPNGQHFTIPTSAGVDVGAAAHLGLTAIHAPGLPGKVAPLTAARAIRRTIYHMLSEREPKG